MGAGPAAAGKRLTAEQRDELFLFRWLFGLSFHDLDTRVPAWEREVLLERMEAWLPRILAGGGMFDAPEVTPVSGTAQLASDGLSLGQLGIHETVVPAPA